MVNKRQQNKIKTPGYFIKRLRDCKFGVLRVFQGYGIHDCRRWTVLVDPGGASVYVTCYNNKAFNCSFKNEVVSNPGLPVSQATALPTVPQQQHNIMPEHYAYSGF